MATNLQIRPDEISDILKRQILESEREIDVYETGIEQAGDLKALEAIGRSIAEARDCLPSEELKELRSLFSRKRNRLNMTSPKGEQIAADDLVRRGYQISERG